MKRQLWMRDSLLSLLGDESTQGRNEMAGLRKCGCMLLTVVLRLATPVLRQASRRRWLDIALLGVTATVVCVLLSPLLDHATEASEWLFDYIWRLLPEQKADQPLSNFGTWQSLVSYAILVVTTSLLIVPLVRLGALRWGHIVSLLLYPPVWLAAVCPFLLFWLFGDHIAALSIFDHDDAHWQCVIILALSAFITLLVTDRKGLVRAHKDLVRTGSRLRRKLLGCKHVTTPLPKAEETLAEFVKDPNGKLIPWLMDDSPVEAPSRDLFESSHSAVHIAELITNKELGPIGLIGPRGCGKTTVLNIVDHFLHDDPGFHEDYRRRWREQSRNCLAACHSPPWILTCRVPAWGFVNESVVAAVLRHIVDELARKVDCLSVRRLPMEYLATLNGAGPAWLQAALAWTADSDPAQQILRLDPLLAAINARLVVFIEDLDRNVAAPDVVVAQQFRTDGKDCRSEAHNDISARQDQRFFVELQSLLDRMNKVKRVSFVLALSRRDA